MKNSNLVFDESKSDIVQGSDSVLVGDKFSKKEFKHTKARQKANGGIILWRFAANAEVKT